eukprot:comp19618_c0_seq1/m.37544 comp19618_c0_seq1/g.37544  ORF comp19618_c0_seq1/g.37544 comp19618_c0_seq1/m.37544 type:complete len:431 (+) comp19618_c0_seq1:2-1294(+)
MLRFVLVALSVFVAASAGYSCKGTPNTATPLPASPVLLQSVPNGKKYSAGSQNNTYNLVHVWGTPFERGKAHGQLLKEEIRNLYKLFPRWLEEQVEQYLPHLPPEIAYIISTLGADAALDLTADATRIFTPDYFFEEMRGVAEGAEVEYATVLRFHMFPELIKASCSMLGAWGSAVQTPGSFYQLRALDWGTDSPMNNVPTLLVYHSDGSTKQGNTFATLTWAGFVGTITGYGTQMAVSEKVWIEYKGKSSRFGIPWHFLLRDILQFDQTLDQAITRVQKAHRTCSIWMGIGSRHDGQFRALGYAYEEVLVFNDTSPFPGYAPTPVQHPLIKNIVYIDKHTQPSGDPCMGSFLQQYNGQINPLRIIEFVSVQQTGDLQIAISDFAQNKLYTSVASQNVPWPPPSNAVAPAYSRQFIEWDMNAIFNEPKDN